MCQDHPPSSRKRSLFAPEDEPPDWETIDLPEPAVLKRRGFHFLPLMLNLECRSNCPSFIASRRCSLSPDRSALFAGPSEKCWPRRIIGNGNSNT